MLTQYDVQSLPSVPTKRKPMNDFHPDDTDRARREYIRIYTCQLDKENFPQTPFGQKLHRFNSKWYKEFQPWLEYSVSKDVVFCLPCYLLRSEVGPEGDAFVNGGFRTWCKPDVYDKHVGGHKSAHNQAVARLNVFKKQKCSISSCSSKQSSHISSAYRLQLGSSIDALRYITLQILPSRGHDETKKSMNKGNFIELLKLIANQSEDVQKVVLQNAPLNCKMIAYSIQKVIINAFAKETTKRIIDDIDGDFFSILVDESADIVDQEQLALCLRNVSMDREIKERFFAIVHVVYTTFITLKTVIESILLEQSLSLSKVRSQGYDGASNKQSCINGLKTLIVKDSPLAYHVHCFAHHLQLTLVAVCKKNNDCCWLFHIIRILLNLVTSSPKRKDILHEKRDALVQEALKLSEFETETDLHRKTTLNRFGDNR